MRKALLIVLLATSLFFGAFGIEMARLSLLANPEVADAQGWVYMRKIITRRYPLDDYKRGGLLPVKSSSDTSNISKAAFKSISIQLLSDKPWQLKWGPGIESVVFGVGWTPVTEKEKEQVEFTFHNSWITWLPFEKWGINILRRPFLESTRVTIRQHLR